MCWWWWWLLDRVDVARNAIGLTILPLCEDIRDVDERVCIILSDDAVVVESFSPPAPPPPLSIFVVDDDFVFVIFV